ncbi:MAG: 23S rRNA (adenine(2503)-C(2))-methyltransferase RlmN [Prevotella sp.]|nr:23S rRNA (adenine(2503)-C(2))-methyltransferase RlmN [Prevotella sp.]
MENAKRRLLGMTPTELKSTVTALGMPAFTARQIAEWMYQKHATSIDEMTNISKANRALLQEHFTTGLMPPLTQQRSVDGTVKYLFPVGSENSEHSEFSESSEFSARTKAVETVFIPDGERGTLCVSSQVGCKMNCLFCQTGKQGWEGNLSAADILNQIEALPERDRLTNIVLMGQGEPMDNLEAVLRALEVLTAPWGWAWSPKRITVSSVGIRGKLKRFLDESQCHVAISMHSPLPDERLRLMPAERAMPIAQTVELLRQYDFTHQRRCSFEYICFGGLNDSLDHGRAIVNLVKGLECRVNLIRFHEILGVGLPRSDEKQMERLRDYLTQQGVFTTIRASRGEDIFAACGMLYTKARSAAAEN